MRRLSLLLVSLFSIFLFAGSSKAQDKIQIFGGYSYVRPPVTLVAPVTCPVGVPPPCGITNNTHVNLNGWEFSGTINKNGWIGLTADFSGHYGSIEGASTHLQTYLFGPQVRFPAKVSPFAHVLFGGAHESGGSNAFATAVGAGIDIKVAPLVSFRPIQIDYLMTRFGSGTQNQPRVSAGIVLHF